LNFHSFFSAVPLLTQGSVYGDFGVIPLNNTRIAYSASSIVISLPRLAINTSAVFRLLFVLVNTTQPLVQTPFVCNVTYLPSPTSFARNHASAAIRSFETASIPSHRWSFLNGTGNFSRPTSTTYPAVTIGEAVTVRIEAPFVEGVTPNSTLVFSFGSNTSAMFLGCNVSLGASITAPVTLRAGTGAVVSASSYLAPTGSNATTLSVMLGSLFNAWNNLLTAGDVVVVELTVKVLDCPRNVNNATITVNASSLIGSSVVAVSGFALHVVAPVLEVQVRWVSISDRIAVAIATVTHAADSITEAYGVTLALNLSSNATVTYSVVGGVNATNILLLSKNITVYATVEFHDGAQFMEACGKGTAQFHSAGPAGRSITSGGSSCTQLPNDSSSANFVDRLGGQGVFFGGIAVLLVCAVVLIGIVISRRRSGSSGALPAMFTLKSHSKVTVLPAGCDWESPLHGAHARAVSFDNPVYDRLDGPFV